MKRRAFVKYTESGKIVPGSLIITQGGYPDGPAVWNEVPVDLCCESGVKVILNVIEGFPISTPFVQVVCGMGPTLAAGAVIGVYNTPEALVVALNAQASFLGVFSVDAEGNVVLAVATDIADVLFNNPECQGASGNILPFFG